MEVARRHKKLQTVIDQLWEGFEIKQMFPNDANSLGLITGPMNESLAGLELPIQSSQSAREVSDREAELEDFLDWDTKPRYGEAKANAEPCFQHQ